MSNVISKTIAPVITASVRKVLGSGLNRLNPVSAPISMTGFLNPIFSTGVNTTQTIDLSGLSVQAGDFILVGVMRAEQNNATITIPDLNYIVTSEISVSDSADANLMFAYKIADGTETSVDISVASIGGGANTFHAAVFRNVDTTNPLDINVVTASGTNGTSPDIPNLQPVTDGTMIVSAICYATRNDNATTLDGIDVFDTVNAQTHFSTRGCSSVVGVKYISDKTAFNPAPFVPSISQVRDSWVASTIALRPIT